MRDENDIEYTSQYKLTELIMMIDDEKLELSQNNLLSVEYINDYDQYIYPIFKITIRLDIKQLSWILKHKKEIKCKFSMSVYGTHPDNYDIVYPEEDVWNELFYILTSEDDISMDENVLENRREKNSPDDTEDLQTEQFHDSQHSIDLYLFNIDFYEKSRMHYNAVFTETTIQNAIAEMLTYTEHKNVLMSKIENDEEYKELIIPPLSMHKCLTWLDNIHGLYKTGAVIYYDIDTLYILNTNGEITAMREDEWEHTNFLVMEMDDATPGNGMILKPDEEIYYANLNEFNITPTDPSKGNEMASANKIQLLKVDSTDVKWIYNDIDENKNPVIKTQWTKSRHKYIDSIIKARLTEGECIIYIHAANLNINAFKPNKQFTVTYQNDEKNGKYSSNIYRMTFAYHVLQFEGDGHMISDHSIIIKKVK